MTRGVRRLGVVLAMSLGIGAAQAQTDAGYWQFRGDSEVGLAPTAIDLSTEASGRYAVVVGNSDYEVAPDLPNAERDASAMAAFLRSRGFRVEERFNITKRGFEDLLRQVLFDAEPDSAILFYFAGHGLQIGRRNYLVPVDADLSTAYDTPFETVTLDSVVRILGARSRLQLVMLDSCRDNPFAGAKMMTELTPALYETQSGFNPMFTPVNSLIAYATSPGAVAFDGSGDNSPFTGSFIEVATGASGASMREILDRVRRDVYSRTGGRQVPWESSTLVEPFVLRSLAANEVVSGSSATAGEGGGTTRGLQLVATASQSQAAGDTASARGAAIEAPLERRIAIGAALRGQLGADATRVALDRPRYGRLYLGERIYDGAEIDATELDRLVYAHTPRQRPATGPVADLILTEQIRIAAAGAETEIALDLVPQQCDVEAGDWLDPDGVGLARYPNEIVPASAVPACRAAVAERPEVGRFHYQLGRALQADLQYDEAKAAFETARDLGHTRAWHALGDLIAEGASIAGGQVNEIVSKEALDHYARGVEKGDPYAYHALGKQLLRFGETEGRRRLGFDLLSQALELGHTFSMNELGYYFMQPDSEHYEPDRGLRYLQESAARNDMFGYNNLGLVYDKGLGNVAADAEKALEWYRKAADEGHVFAPVNIGRMYYNGRLGSGPDLSRAIEWYDLGLERGNPWGGANASWIIANRRPSGLGGADAAVRAAKAAALRDEEAAATAREVLAGLDRRAIDGATQMLVREFRPEQEVDGVAGPNTVARISELAAEFGVTPPGDDALERLDAMARIFWKAKGLRIDLL